MSGSNLNHVCLAGNLTRDPVVRQINGGKMVADIGLACHERYTDKDGKEVEQTHFFDIVAWGKTASAVAAYLKKADPLLVEGTLINEQWETQQGEKRSRVRVRANRVHFIGGRRSSGAKESAAAAPTADAADDNNPSF